MEMAVLHRFLYVSKLKRSMLPSDCCISDLKEILIIFSIQLWRDGDMSVIYMHMQCCFIYRTHMSLCYVRINLII